jgi:hypothetical protein
VGGLHPGTRARRSQPHVPDRGAGGRRAAAAAGVPSRPDGLVHVTPRSGLVRAKGRASLPPTDRCPLVDAHVWHQAGVVHGQPVGRAEAAGRSLAPDRVRLALRHHRVRTRDDGHVTLPSKASATAPVHTSTVPAAACRRRWLPHGRPDRGLHVRADGCRRPGTRPVRPRVSPGLGAHPVATATTGPPPDGTAATPAREAPRCPTCGHSLILGATRRPHTRAPPGA